MPQVSQTAILPTSVQHDPSTLILQVLPRTNKKLQNFRKSPTPSDIVGTNVKHFVFKYHCKQVKNSNASSITTIILSTSVQHDPSTLILQVLPRTYKQKNAILSQIVDSFRYRWNQFKTFRLQVSLRTGQKQQCLKYHNSNTSNIGATS